MNLNKLSKVAKNIVKSTSKNINVKAVAKNIKEIAPFEKAFKSIPLNFKGYNIIQKTKQVLLEGSIGGQRKGGSALVKLGTDVEIGNTRFNLDVLKLKNGQSVMIGRDYFKGVDGAISKQHLLVKRIGDFYELTDLNSLHGTKINFSNLYKIKTLLGGIELDVKRLSADELRDKFQVLSPDNFKHLVNQNYANIRRKTYESSITGNKDLLQRMIVDNGISDVRGVRTKTRKNGYWTDRFPSSVCNNTKLRASLNVNGDARLISALDKLMEETKAFKYKTPNNLQGWSLREDPITIYFEGDKVRNSLVNEIVRISAPFRRDKIHGSLFTRAPWMSVQFDGSNQKLVKQLIARAYSIDNRIGSMVEQYCQKHTPMSSGMFESCEILLEEYKQYLAYFG